MRYIKKLELKSRRVKLAENPVPYNTAISQPKDAARIINSILDGEEQEVFLVIPVDVKNKVLGYEEVHRGSVDECPVSMKTVFRTAVHMGATAILVAHNHPSGDPTPSREDLALTDRLREAGKLLGLPLLDHLIIGGGGQYTSLAERGLLDTAVPA